MRIVQKNSGGLIKMGLKTWYKKNENKITIGGTWAFLLALGFYVNEVFGDLAQMLVVLTLFFGVLHVLDMFNNAKRGF